MFCGEVLTETFVAGNNYAITNESTVHVAKLFFAQGREPDLADEEGEGVDEVADADADADANGSNRTADGVTNGRIETDESSPRRPLGRES